MKCSFTFVFQNEKMLSRKFPILPLSTFSKCKWFWQFIFQVRKRESYISHIKCKDMSSWEIEINEWWNIFFTDWGWGCVAEVSPHEILIFKFLIKKVRKQTLLTFVFCRRGNAIAATIDQLPLLSSQRRKLVQFCLK